MSSYNKLLSDILRCEEFLKRYINGVPYSECLIPTRPEHLVEVKSKYIYNLDEAKEIAKNIVEIVKDVKQKYMDEHEVVINNKALEVMQEALVGAIKQSILEDIT